MADDDLSAFYAELDTLAPATDDQPQQAESSEIATSPQATSAASSSDGTSATAPLVEQAAVAVTPAVQPSLPTARSIKPVTSVPKPSLPAHVPRGPVGELVLTAFGISASTVKKPAAGGMAPRAALKPTAVSRPASHASTPAGAVAAARSSSGIGATTSNNGASSSSITPRLPSGAHHSFPGPPSGSAAHPHAPYQPFAPHHPFQQGQPGQAYGGPHSSYPGYGGPGGAPAYGMVPPGAAGPGGDAGAGGGEGDGEDHAGHKRKRNLRTCAGEVWEDATLDDWPAGDIRIFCGDLGNEVTDESLAAAFRRYASFARAKVIKEKKTHKSRGYGFISFLDPMDALAALKEMNGQYIGNRPVRLRRAEIGEKDLKEVRKRDRDDDARLKKTVRASGAPVGLR